MLSQIDPFAPRENLTEQRDSTSTQALLRRAIRHQAQMFQGLPGVDVAFAGATAFSHGDLTNSVDFQSQDCRAEAVPQ